MNDVVKKKSSKKVIALVAGGVILGGAIAAWAGVRSYWHHGDHMADAIDHISEELVLNQDQRSRLESLGVTLQSFKRSMRNGDEIDVVLSSVQGPALDQSSLNALVEAKLDTARAQLPELVAAVAQFYDSLDANQQAEAREEMGEIADWIQDRRRHR